MDKQLIEISSFPILNEYCILRIIDGLDMTDYINFINSNDYLFDISKMWTHWKFSKLFIDADWIGTLHTEKTLLSIGHHIKEVIVDFDGIDDGNIENILKEISKNCVGLKRLCFRNYKSANKYNNLVFSNVETLSFTWCNGNIVRECLRSFGSLKFLNFHDCDVKSITDNDWTALFESNQNIESIHLPNGFNGGELLSLLPRLDKLYGCHSMDQKKTSVELKSLIRCNRLTKLRLLCDENNDFHDFLIGLCNRNIIEELSLTYLGVFNSKIFDALKLSVKMKVLVIWLDGTLLPSLTWPGNLKKLRLQNCRITLVDFVGIIKQLKHLEQLDLLQCKIVDQHGALFNNPEQLSRHMSNAYKISGNQQLLNVRLPNCYYQQFKSNEHFSKKIINASIKIVGRNEKMRIENNTGFDVIRLKHHK